MTWESLLPPSWRATATAYARLESAVRRVIDTRTGALCPACRSLCCRAVYCSASQRNPWYRCVRRAVGVADPVPRAGARPGAAFGLGAAGCEIRAGRYVFCYSFNCRRLLQALPRGASRAAFVEVSELLLEPNRLPGRRWLHELTPDRPLEPADLNHLDATLATAWRRLQTLAAELDEQPRASPDP